MNLTAEQQALLNTNFGDEMEKAAAERVGACNNAYAYGFSKLAAEAADAKDEEDKNEKEEEGKKEDKKLDEESEKAAAELGAFIERGFFDGLCKLGSERHGNELHYIEPMLMNKVAASKGMEAVKALGSKIKSYHTGIAEDVASAVKGQAVSHRGGGKFVTNPALANLTGKERGMAAGRAAAKLSPYAALGGAGAYAATRGGKKEENK